MAHHNFEIQGQSNLSRLLRDGSVQPGATGEYPNGKYALQDEGEIVFNVAADTANQVVLVDFGKPVHSLGMTPQQAWELGELLQKKSWECRGITS